MDVCVASLNFKLYIEIKSPNQFTMRVVLFFFILLISGAINAQSNYVSTYLENPNYYASQLHKIPWDSTRLIQYRNSYDGGFPVLIMEDVTNGVITPIVPPLCSEIRSIPVIVDDGYLFAGETISGVELLYFDEVNSTVFDLNIGVNDSDPVIYELNDRVFVIAFDGTHKQLFEFDKSTHAIVQITNNSIDVNSVCAVWGSNVYYSTKFVNSINGLDEYTLVKAVPVVSGFDHFFVQNINIPTSADRYVDWKTPQLIWGKLFLAAVDVSPYSDDSNTMGISVILPNDQVSTANITLPSFGGEFSLVQWDGKLGVYCSEHNEFFVSSDGVNFDTEAVPSNGKLVECMVSENDKLYFNCMYLDETREVFQYDNGFQSKYYGDYVYFLSEEEGIIYSADYVPGDSSSIVLLYTTVDVVDEVKMSPAYHPPHTNTSVMHEGFFTFLFRINGPAFDHDIFQLKGSPSANLEELNVDFSVYPNPVASGSTSFIRTNREGEAELLTLDGQKVSSFNVTPGTNLIPCSQLPSGVYLISFENRTHRIVVN